ncbi:MAG: carbohydrate ABC transporter permease [Elusimicrobiota bacterium]|jgi:raffinose/stachyose/melibiose transport system permease protein|nr:carbohydrate ABC transporter permease [Elusimicrobiota bacterium]
MNEKKKDLAFFVGMALLSIICLAPIAIVLINSFKGQFFISSSPFSLPDAKTFAGLSNYLGGVGKIGFWKAFGYSCFITVFSVCAIVLLTSMTAWMITRVKSKLSKGLYYAFVFSMIVPFQMVMFTMSKIANMLNIDNPIGIILIYVGFGSGLSIFLFSGFIKSIPVDIEEAAMIDGCSPIRIFFSVIFPILKPISITVAILNTMWIWNDYLLPNLVIGSNYRTIPIAIQYLQGGYGSRDMGALMAMLILAIIPVIILYLVCQKYIIKGVMSGAVKG